jgi:hypothetical protein
MIPLAIELAASRTGAADKKTLDDLLRDLRGDSLAGASAGARSRGMEAAGMADIFRLMEYQIGLLDEPARRDFYPLSLFRETFDFEAARGAFGVSSEPLPNTAGSHWCGPPETVCTGSTASSAPSALRPPESGGVCERGEKALRIHGRAFASHFLRLFSLREDPLAVVERYGGEIEAAWFHALGNRDWDLVVRIAVPLGSFLHYHGQERKAASSSGTSLTGSSGRMTPGATARAAATRYSRSPSSARYSPCRPRTWNTAGGFSRP